MGRQALIAIAVGRPPFGEQANLIRHIGAIHGRHAGRNGRRPKFGQEIDRGAVKRRRAGAAGIVDITVKTEIAQILQQHQAKRAILGQYFRRAVAEIAQMPCDAAERFDIDGAGIHQHGAVGAAPQALIAPRRSVTGERRPCRAGPSGGAEKAVDLALALNHAARRGAAGDALRGRHAV